MFGLRVAIGLALHKDPSLSLYQKKKTKQNLLTNKLNYILQTKEGVVALLVQQL